MIVFYIIIVFYIVKEEWLKRHRAQDRRASQLEPSRIGSLPVSLESEQRVIERSGGEGLASGPCLAGSLLYLLLPSRPGRAISATVKCGYSGPPMTLGNAVAADVCLIAWCRACHHQVEPDPAEMAERYGPETTIPDWA